jgi:transposase
MEIITGVERRRRWRDEDKLRIVAEAEAPGAVFCAVARRYDVSRGQLWTWRQKFRDGVLSPASEVADFLPVRMLSEPEHNDRDAVSVPVALTDDLQARAEPPSIPTTSHARLEITLPNGASIRAEGGIDPAMLCAAISAAKG